jgi:hypothetical protein
MTQIAVKNSNHSKRRIVLSAALALLIGFGGFSYAFAQSAFDDPGARGAAGAKGGGGGGEFVPVDKEAKGGTVTIGATAQVVVLFRNDSGRPLSVGEPQLYPSSTVSAMTALNQCNKGQLTAGAVCAIAVSVKGLSTGSWRVDMLVPHSGNSKLSTATLSGTVDAGGKSGDTFISDIEAIPSELDFGTLDNSQPIIKAVVMRNITSEAIDINAVYVEAADQAGYKLRTDCEKLEPGQACVVGVTWSPVLKGQSSGVLLVEHTGPTTIASINLKGVYSPTDVKAATVFPQAVPGMGLMVSSQDSIDFGSGIDTTSTITVSLVNVGDAPMTIEDIKMSGTDSGVSLSKEGCAPRMVLEPVQACPLTVKWSPVRAGAILDDVQVVHNGARGVLVLPVRGDASGVVSQDNKAIRLVGDDIAVMSAPNNNSSSASVPSAPSQQQNQSIDPSSVLDGFIVTSHAPKRAIISGPGGSRIVNNNEEVVVGGFLWHVNIRPSGVEFRSGGNKVLLLFDRSLSSVNKVGGQSSGGSSGSSASTSGAADSSTPAAAAPATN